MTQKQKLLLIADTYYPKVDGTMRFMDEFTKRARDLFNISFLVPYFGNKKPTKNDKPDYPLTFLETSKIFKISGYPSIKFSLSNIQKIKKEVQKADIIFIQGPALTSFIAMYYGKKLNKKTIFYVHTIAWELFTKFFPKFMQWVAHRIIKKVVINLYNRCSQIFVPYYCLKEYLLKSGVHTKIKVAKLGVNIAVFSESKDKKQDQQKINIPPDHFVIGYVGRISKEKNTNILVEAFKKVQQHQPKVYLLIVGDGIEEQKQKIKSISSSKITGFVPNVEDYLKAMDVFVMPSLTETTSLATLEAMSCGLPIIASKVGFIKDYVVKDYNGLFFPKNSASILALKIEYLLKNPQKRKLLGENARKTVIYSFSWERSIDRIKKALLE